MNTQHQVPIDTLVTISKDLISTFFRSSDIYSLLVLSLVTITTYSRTRHRLSAQVRIDLTITFLPELIRSLQASKVISSDVATHLTEQCVKKQDKLSKILRAYLYAAIGLHPKPLR